MIIFNNNGKTYMIEVIKCIICNESPRPGAFAAFITQMRQVVKPHATITSWNILPGINDDPTSYIHAFSIKSKTAYDINQAITLLLMSLYNASEYKTSYIPTSFKDYESTIKHLSKIKQ